MLLLSTLTKLLSFRPALLSDLGSVQNLFLKMYTIFFFFFLCCALSSPVFGDYQIFLDDSPKQLCKCHSKPLSKALQPERQQLFYQILCLHGYLKNSLFFFGAHYKYSTLRSFTVLSTFFSSHFDVGSPPKISLLYFFRSSSRRLRCFSL